MTPETRVTFVSSHSKPGGSELYLERLLQGLRHTHPVGVIALEDGPLVRRLEALGVSVAVVRTSRAKRGLLCSAWRVRRLLARDRASVVHANGVKAALVGVLATWGRPQPVVWFKHDFSWDDRLGPWIARRCALVVGVSHAVLVPIRRPGVRAVRVLTGIAPVPVDMGVARSRLVDEVGSEGPFIVLIGRLHSAKGHAEILAALPAIRGAVPNATAVFIGGDDAGEPDLGPSLRATAPRDSVCFLGHREDARSLLAGADVLVVPSGVDRRGMGHEGFGLAALEAMAAGVAVVAYAGGGVAEVVGDAAILVATGDHSALGDAVIGLLTDTDRRQQLVAAGRARVATEFTEGAWLRAVEDIYEYVARSSVRHGAR